MKILITGGNGYIAKNIYNKLYTKYDIIAPGRDELDLTNIQSINKFFKDKQFDVVIHTAIRGGSRLQEDNEDVMLTNLEMFSNLISHQDKFLKLINLGSGAEIYMSETPYGKSKKIINECVQKKDNWYTLRIFGAFNENELDTRFIKANIKRYLNKEPIQIFQNKLMDFFYMEDLVSLIEFYILHKPGNRDLDCVYNKTISLEYIANLINQLSDYQVPIHFIEEKMGNCYIGFNNGLPIECLGLEQGIKNVYNKLKNEY
jgi:nucleoside-diphosphate-sugar epimerase